MALYDGRKLGVWRSSDKKWTDVDVASVDDSMFADIIHHNKKFYALEYGGLIVTVDPKSLKVTEVTARRKDNTFGFGAHYLVESSRKLFVIVKLMCCTNSFLLNSEVERVHFNVYKLDEEKRKWVRAIDELRLEDRAWFLADDCSFSVSAEEFFRM